MVVLTVIKDMEDVTITKVLKGLPFIHTNDLKVFKRSTKQCINSIDE
jgi:hypothetical protein